MKTLVTKSFFQQSTKFIAKIDTIVHSLQIKGGGVIIAVQRSFHNINTLKFDDEIPCYDLNLTTSIGTLLFIEVLYVLNVLLQHLVYSKCTYLMNSN